MIMARLREHVPPARRRLADSQTKKRQRNLSQYILRDQDSSLGQQDPPGERRYMPADQVNGAGAEPACAQNVASFFGAQHDAPDEPRRTDPPHRRDDSNYQPKRLQGADV